MSERSLKPFSFCEERHSPKLFIVIPCYNEEEVLPQTAPLFLEELKHLISKHHVSSDSRIMFVDDGSRDATWSIIKKISRDDERFCGISLSRNRGHQNALLAGLMTVKDLCDISISIDCDGQDDITAMEAMICAYLDGADVVYGIRSDRVSDTAFKRITAQGFYKLLAAMGVESIYNHADYRLMDHRAMDALAEFKEVNLFLRGLVPLVGFESQTVEYSRAKRISGKSHYPLFKMIGLALNGISSMSIVPLRVIAGTGTLIAILSFIGIVWSFVVAFIGQTVPGWASLMSAVFLMGGLQLFAMGIVGEYIGKIYLETKGRPRYIISDFAGEELHATCSRQVSQTSS